MGELRAQPRPLPHTHTQVMPATRDKPRPDDEACEPPSSSSSPPESSDVEPEDSLDLAEFARRSGRRDKVHVPRVDGGLPPCARNVTVEPAGYGLWYHMLAASNRAVCKHCCRKLATTPEFIASRCESFRQQGAQGGYSCLLHNPQFA